MPHPPLPLQRAIHARKSGPFLYANTLSHREHSGEILSERRGGNSPWPPVSSSMSDIPDVPEYHMRPQDALITLGTLAGFVIFSSFLLQSLRLSLIMAASLAAHELGHILVDVTQGVHWRLRFTPIGARLETPLQQRRWLSHYENALIHLAGPAASLLYAAMAILVYYLTIHESSDLLQLANFSAQVGLFNLLPLGRATDGGKFLERVFTSLNNRDDWRIFWLPIIWGVTVLGGTMLAFYLEHSRELIPPHVLSYLLVVLWLVIGMLVEKRHEDPLGWISAQAMTYRQAWRLMLSVGILLLACTLIVTMTPFWLPPEHILTMASNIRHVAALLFH
jgi:hypothetical protein